jgi:hypothetical protein
MTITRAAALAALVGVLAGCGPDIPPAGNYATVSGQVTSSATGTGVAGATVSVNVVLSATSDANGNFKITNVPTGPWSYSVTAPSGFTAPAGSDSNPPLAPGEVRTLNISLTKS